MIIFHGTSTAHKEQILREGLLPRSKTGISNWKHDGSVESKTYLVYLSLAYPVYFALQATEETDDLLILKVEVDESELYPDEDFLAYAAKIQGLYDLPLTEIIPLVEPFENKHMAEDCLKHNGIIAVKKVLPEQIIDHRVIASNEGHSIMAVGGDAMPIPMNFKVLGGLYQKAIEILFRDGLPAAVKVMTDRWECPEMMGHEYLNHGLT